MKTTENHCFLYYLHWRKIQVHISLNTLFVIFILNSSLFGQKSLPVSFYENYNKYHQFLLTKNPQSVDSLGKFITTIYKRFPEPVADDILKTIFKFKKFQKLSNTAIHDYFKKQYQGAPYFEEISPDTYNIIDENLSLVTMISDREVFIDPPFERDTTDLTLFKTLPFYEIKPNDRIAEIGAGEGSFSLYLSFLYNNEIFINELDTNRLSYLSDYIQEYAQHRPDHHLHIVKGSETSTGLDTASMNIILMNNAYHHFSRPIQMMQSIHQSLKKDGILYVGETVRDYDYSNHSCPDIMMKRKIIKAIEKQGFRLEKEARTLIFYLMKFRKVG